MSKIIITGGSGTLGTELLKINKNILAPSHEELDVCNQENVFKYLKENSPDILIHCAAVIDNRILTHTPTVAINTNIIGTANVAIACEKLNVRVVYISTDYIYRGSHGNYKESDSIYPFNFYAWTKLGGEASMMGVKNHLTIRVSFGKSEFPYKQSFIDKWSSKDYIDVIAPMIYEASLSPLTGILNLGTERKTLYSHAAERNPSVNAVKLSETTFHTPYDTSFNLQKWIDYKGSKSVSKTHENCRVCGSSKLVKYLDLGLLPLANNLETTFTLAINADKFPLQVMFCKECHLSQLSVVINPERLFSYYTYRSGINKGYVIHCQKMAEELTEKFNLTTDSFHIDIAGNDGTLLKVFKDTLDHNVLNVDPASNLTAISESIGIPCITDFWGMHLVDKVKKADLITATNVFAHLDDVREFMEACKKALKPEGVLVIENPYLIDFIENNEFDTIYFEHVTYWSLIPMMKLCQSLGLKVIDAEKQSIHGGTMRYTITHLENDIAVSPRIDYTYHDEQTKGYDRFETYLKWSDDVKNIIDDFSANMLALKKQGNTIIGFAASAKGNTLLNSAKINTDIMDVIVDQTPEKISKNSPGTGIPIVGIDKIMKMLPDYIVILSWNFAEEIIEKVRSLGYEGKFIIPIPTWKVL